MYNDQATLAEGARAYDYRLGPVVCGFLLGAGVGAGLGVLLAPAAGRDTRDRLAERARRGRDAVSDVVERSRTAVEQARTHAARAADLKAAFRGAPKEAVTA